MLLEGISQQNWLEILGFSSPIFPIVIESMTIFQRWERLNEVFISWKLNRWKMRFEFVRFYDVKNERRRDNICIGNVKLYVNISRYRRYEDHKIQPIMNNVSSFYY